MIRSLLLIALLGPVGLAHGSEPHWTRLSDLLRQARTVVAGTVTRTTPYDDMRVLVANVLPDRVLKGEAPGEVAIVEEHDLPSTPVLFTTGQHVLVFLGRAGRTSALAKVLPAGPTYDTPIDGRMGVIASPSAETIAEAAAIVARLVEASTDVTSDADQRAAATRALAFDEIAARHPVLVEDGAAAVTALPSLAATLTDAERHVLQAALQRTDLPVRVRVAVVRVVGAQRLVALGATLHKLDAPAPEVLAASWEVLRALGSPPALADLKAYLASPDPAVRTVVPAALLAASGAEGVPAVERLALHDGDLGVQKAAVAALAASKLPAALTALEHVYAGSSGEVLQAAGTAILEWGGDPAANAFARLAFKASPPAERWAVTLLFALGRTKDDPLVKKIRDTHPDPSIRELIDHGFDFGSELLAH